ncbi:unnamed protein product, partial [Owenia fusiformis]
MYEVFAIVLLVAVATAAPSDSVLRWTAIEPAQEVKQMHQVPLYKFDDTPKESLWEQFKQKHKKIYETIEEEKHRFGVFLQNLKTIELHNYLHSKGKKTFRLGTNEYADMELEEFVSVMNGFKGNSNASKATSRVSYMSPSFVNVPEEVDWRTKGYVTDVKNQGHCGSCWAFSTTGSLEGQHFKQTGKLVSLSEQNLVDCSKSYGNNGCNGGLMDNAFQYIKENKGIDTETSYPYEGEDEKCHFKKRTVGATDAGYVDVTSGSEEKLKEACATVGPISVAIDAGHQSFQLYESGVYVEPKCSSTQLDHGVLVVGYGTTDDGD